jgi:hypothetical protein
MATFFRRLANILRARQSDADLAEEMEHHRELKQRALELQGIPKREAESLSRRALGNSTLAREDARAIWIAPSIDSVRQDIAYALRSLRKNAAFSLALILVSALGIGTTTAVFGLLDVLMYRPLPVSAPDRLVYLKDAVIGRTFTADDDVPGGGPGGMVAVIGYDCWQRRFAGDSSVIGRTVQIDRRTFTIVGVTRKGFFGVAPGLAPEITIPLTTVQSAGSLAQVSTSWLHLMGRLRDGVSHEQAIAEPNISAGQPRSSLASRVSPACGVRSENRCACSSRSSGCFSPLRVPARQTCCSLAASRASAKSQSGWQ